MQSANRIDRERLLLSKLAKAKSQTLTAAAIAPVKPATAFHAVGLTDRSAIQAAVRDLIAAGWVVEENQRRSVKYVLTEAGAAHLASLPAPPEREKKAQTRKPRDVAALPENPHLLPYQRAFLLAQLLSADGRTLTDGQANKLPKVAKEDLELTGPLASQLRRKLAEEGYLRCVKEGRRLLVTLTDDGLQYLATLRHHPAGNFTMSGAALNALLDTAAKAGGGHTASDSHAIDAPPKPPGTAAALPAELGAAAYAVFRELVRERFSRNGLVPIFEIRRELARRYGPAAARHDVLDQPIMALWRDRKVRLVSISDTRSASAAELEDSITDSYETLFYMEDGHDHDSAR